MELNTRFIIKPGKRRESVGIQIEDGGRGYMYVMSHMDWTDKVLASPLYKPYKFQNDGT